MPENDKLAALLTEFTHNILDAEFQRTGGTEADQAFAARNIAATRGAIFALVRGREVGDEELLSTFRRAMSEACPRNTKTRVDGNAQLEGIRAVIALPRHAGYRYDRELVVVSYPAFERLKGIEFIVRVFPLQSANQILLFIVASGHQPGRKDHNEVCDVAHFVLTLFSIALTTQNTIGVEREFPPQGR